MKATKTALAAAALIALATSPLPAQDLTAGERIRSGFLRGLEDINVHVAEFPPSGDSAGVRLRVERRLHEAGIVTRSAPKNASLFVAIDTRPVRDYDTGEEVARLARVEISLMRGACVLNDGPCGPFTVWE